MPTATKDAEMVPATEETLSSRLEKANASSDAKHAESEYRAIIASVSTADDVKTSKEAAIIALAKLLVKEKRPEEVVKLSKEVRPFYATIPKAKTAKIVRGILDTVARQGVASIDVQRTLCNDTIEWCRTEKRTFLRQRIEGRLASLFLQSKQYSESLDVVNNLLREVKRLDDKAHLLEIQLIESRIHHALRNIPKARAALTSARTTANAIYVPPALQAEIDMQAGIIAAEEKDYKTAYSYFYEGFEGFQNLNDSRAVTNLKYMLLCKIMAGRADDVNTIVTGQIALKYPGPDVDAMKAVAKAHGERSLENFEKTLADFKKQLSEDPIVHAHLDVLYNTLKEQNLLRLIEPFSRVEISHVAKLIRLEIDDVESKLSQMILDKKLNGILDQGEGCLVVFDDLPISKTYQSSLDTLVNMGNVVDSLFDKAAVLR